MAVRFPGTIGLMLRRLTPEFRYDVGIAGGHIAFGTWVYPEDVSSDQEVIVIVDRTAIAPPLDAVVYAVLRIEGSFVAPGTITVILQGSLFGFCSVRRSAPGTLVVNRWQRVEVVCKTGGMTDVHLYVDGTEVTYAFSRSEPGLPPHGGSDILFGSTYRGDGVTAPHYACGSRTINGDTTNGDLAKRFTTAAGGFFKGGMSHPGFWHSGSPQLSDGLIQSLADGFSPSFLAHYIESSTVSKALLMCPGLYGDGEPSGSAYNPEVEHDPKSGIKLEYTLGSGACTWMDGPGVCEPVGPEIEGPGPTVPKTPRLCLPFGLPRAELYTNPGDPAALLPIVYGDFRVGGLRGPVPATLIDKPDADAGVTRWTYCAAYHPSVSVEKVYIGDVEQAFSLDTVDPSAAVVVGLSNNFQGGGTITTISFLPDASNPRLSPEGQPLDQVSWRGRGHYDDTGLVLMENCIDQVVHLLTTWGNFERAEDFDLTALAEATARVNELGYLTAFVVLSEAVTQDWITEMLFNVMGYWRVNGRQQLEFHVDDGSAFTAADVTAHVVASRDCVDGDDGVAFVLDRRNLVNELVAYYLYSYSLDGPSSRIVSLRDATSVEAYGEMKKSVTLKGLRRAADVAVWAAILLLRQSARTRVEGGHLAFTLKEGRFAHLTIGDHVAFTWPYGPTREGGNPYANEILRVVQIDLDAARGGGFAVVAQDLGSYLTGGAANARLLAAVE